MKRGFGRHVSISNWASRSEPWTTQRDAYFLDKPWRLMDRNAERDLGG
jgi:hypothetical protein